MLERTPKQYSCALLLCAFLLCTHSLHDSLTISSQHPREWTGPPIRNRSLSWADVFPDANLTLIAREWKTPELFLRKFGDFKSTNWTDALQTELLGGDVPHLFRRTRLPDVTGWQNRSVADLAKNQKDLRAHKLSRGFRPTHLYQTLAALVCDVLHDTHVWFQGDSTLHRLARQSGLHQFGCKNVSFTTHQTTVKSRTGPNLYYFQRAWSKFFEERDYRFLLGKEQSKKHVLILANFDGLHALALPPARNYSRTQLGSTLFESWNVFVDYQLEQIGKLDEFIPRVSPHLIVFNTNAIAEECYTDDYAHTLELYRSNRMEYLRGCHEVTGMSLENCANSVFTNEGVDYLNRLLLRRSFPRHTQFLNANYITRERGHLTGDGRHYPPLMPLKIVHIVGQYMVMRIMSALVNFNAI